MTDDPLLDVAADLRAIRDMSADLPRQAAHKATASAMPGGEAMAELGPVANVGAVELRNRINEAVWLAQHGEDWCQEHETIKMLCQHRFNPWDEDTTVLQSLRWWTEEYRARTQTVTEAWTLRTEVQWLLDNLPWVRDNEPHWNDLCRDVADARRRLEDVLSAGEREERSWVPCIDCEIGRDGQPIRVRLVKFYGWDDARKPITIRPIRLSGRWESEDRWVCKRCRREYERDAFNQAEAQARGEAQRRHREMSA